MFNFIRKSFHHFKHSAPTHELHMLQLNHILSFSSKPTSENPKDRSFTVNYLVNKCGFAPEKAILTSKYVNFNNPDKPDAVLTFLKNQGFSETQISRVIRFFPQLIVSSPKNTLLPKIEFFLSQGVSKADLPTILAVAPRIFTTSLERSIIPSFSFLKNLFGSAEETILSITRYPRLLESCRNPVATNIEMLRKANVPEARVKSLLMKWPRALICDPNKFERVVDKLKKMGADPAKSTFSIAVAVSIVLNRSAWKKKMSVYKKWGYSEDEVLAVFVTYPWCMTVSEDKTDGVMDFLVNEMGWKSPRLMYSSRILSLSLNKRIIPRCSLYRILLSKGFIKEHSNLYSLLIISEDKFRKRYVEFFGKKAPELLNLYEEKMRDEEKIAQ